MTLPEILEAHDKSITAAIAVFQNELEGIVSAAKAKLQSRLQESLDVDRSGKIKRTRANAKVLAQIDDWFVEEMAASGYVPLTKAFVNSFPGQLPYFDQVVDYLATQTGKPLQVDWTAADKRRFADAASTARLTIDSVVQSVATTAKSQILLSFGGLSYKEMLVSLAQKLDTTVERVVTLADTSISTFYRTVAAAGFQKLEFHFQKASYRGAGPIDKLNRPFCRHLMTEGNAGKSWTREEIDKMSNGQIPNVFLTFGGWNCRHSWVLVPDTATAAS